MYFTCEKKGYLNLKNVIVFTFLGAVPNANTMVGEIELMPDLIELNKTGLV